MKGLFGYEVADLSTPTKAQYKANRFLANPMIRAFGMAHDPLARCKDCKNLVYKQYAKRYYKCILRGCSNSEATDHRLHWQACSKFEKFKE